MVTSSGTAAIKVMLGIVQLDAIAARHDLFRSYVVGIALRQLIQAVRPSSHDVWTLNNSPEPVLPHTVETNLKSQRRCQQLGRPTTISVTVPYVSPWFPMVLKSNEIDVGISCCFRDCEDSTRDSARRSSPRLAEQLPSPSIRRRIGNNSSLLQQCFTPLRLQMREGVLSE